MLYIDTIKLPSKEIIYDYWYSSIYPWNIFMKNCFEWVICKNITIFYGNNGSGKSTLLNLIGEKIGAKRTTEIFKDYIYEKGTGSEVHFFDDFVNNMNVRLAVDDNNKPIELPKNIRLITSDDIFKKIEIRTNHNNQTLNQIASKRDEYSEIKKSGNGFKANSSNYDELVKILETRRVTKSEYSRAHSDLKEKMSSNGETALEYFKDAFREGGIYLLDEPENCLSPIFQIELMRMIEDAVRYYNCQFIICSHSPIILSLENAIIYNMDMVPVIPQEWEELDNIKIYYEFFKLKKDKFE